MLSLAEGVQDDPTLRFRSRYDTKTHALVELTRRPNNDQGERGHIGFIQSAHTSSPRNYVIQSAH